MSDCQRQYAFGPFLLNPSGHELLRDGQPVSLTPKAFDMLVVFVENRGRLLEKSELIKAVWHDTFVEEGNLCVSVSLLRKTFGEEHAYIKTVSKHGYRFVADVSVMSTDVGPVLQENPAGLPVAQEPVLETERSASALAGKFRSP